MEVGPSNVVHVVLNNAYVCKAASLIIEAEFPYIYWTSCVMHTLNIDLKNISAVKDTEKHSVVHKECSWITKIVDDAMFIKNFVMGHSMRLSKFNSLSPLKFILVASTRFTSTIVTLKRFKLLKTGL
ncbi:unnamed protein product [Lathyrus sativus]|nr:unnamed protein product [Lathyrus sativus]